MGEADVLKARWNVEGAHARDACTVFSCDPPHEMPALTRLPPRCLQAALAQGQSAEEPLAVVAVTALKQLPSPDRSLTPQVGIDAAALDCAHARLIAR